MMSRRCAPGRGGLAALIGAAALAGVAAGCATQAGGAAASGGAAAAPSIDPPRRPGLPLLFIAMPASAPFQATRHGLVSEIERSFDVTTFIVSAQTSEKDLAAAIDREAPRCLVLMNNTSVKLYREYQQAHVRPWWR